jgi:HemY protein
MIRVVIYLIFIGLAAVVAVWFADRPGEVVITWQGAPPLKTSVGVLGIAAVIVALVAIFAWSILRGLWRTPARMRLIQRARRGRRGYLALSRGLIAVGSGDARAAKRFADEAGRVAPDEPLTLLLGAQAAQLAGDRAAAERTFQAMAQRADTRLLGLHGLFIEAQRGGDAAAARLIAEEAAKSAEAPGWAARAVLEFRCAGADWEGALDRLERNMKAGLLDKPAYQRQRAVLLTARALAAETSDRELARTLALEAVKLAPTLVPAAALAGRLLGEAGDMRRAARVIEVAWQANPHPDLAETYAHLRPGDSARDRLKRTEALARLTPAAIEGALAVAQAALDAREFGIARAALAPLRSAPTQHVALLIAKLAEMEGDEGRAREWTTRALIARRDPAWTADGFVSDRWMPVSPVTGRLDAFEWKEPLAELGAPAGALIESEDDLPDLPPPPEPVLELPKGEPPPSPPEPQHAEPAPPLAPGANGPVKPPAPAPNRLIPLLHAPDDPGPDAEPQSEPETEPPPPPSNGWTRLRQLFK